MDETDPGSALSDRVPNYTDDIIWNSLTSVTKRNLQVHHLIDVLITAAAVLNGNEAY